VVPLIKVLRASTVSIAEKEVERTLSMLKEPDPKLAQSVRSLGQAIVNKILHPVLSKLKQEGAEGDAQPLVDALTKLFDIDPAELEDSERAKETGELPTNVVPIRDKEQHG
jgi:glutamyl-tRNA reductase